jgi:hypothetical protein
VISRLAGIAYFLDLTEEDRAADDAGAQSGTKGLRSEKKPGLIRRSALNEHGPF